MFPIGSDQRSADDRLERKYPVARCGDDPPRLPVKELPDDLAQSKKPHENEERREISSLFRIGTKHTKAVNETKSLEPTPDQLLKLLDLQLAQQRATRLHGSGKRTMIRIVGIFLILGGCVAAILILQYALSELRPGEGVERPMDQIQQAR